MHFDVSHGGDIAVERCEESIAKLLARLRNENAADKTMPKLVHDEVPFEEIPATGNDPDRPAA